MLQQAATTATWLDYKVPREKMARERKLRWWVGPTTKRCRRRRWWGRRGDSAQSVNGLLRLMLSNRSIQCIEGTKKKYVSMQVSLYGWHAPNLRFWASVHSLTDKGTVSPLLPSIYYLSIAHLSYNFIINQHTCTSAAIFKLVGCTLSPQAVQHSLWPIKQLVCAIFCWPLENASTKQLASLPWRLA